MVPWESPGLSTADPQHQCLPVWLGMPAAHLFVYSQDTNVLLSSVWLSTPDLPLHLPPVSTSQMLRKREEKRRGPEVCGALCF